MELFRRLWTSIGNRFPWENGRERIKVSAKDVSQVLSPSSIEMQDKGIKEKRTNCHSSIIEFESSLGWGFKRLAFRSNSPRTVPAQHNREYKMIVIISIWHFLMVFQAPKLCFASGNAFMKTLTKSSFCVLFSFSSSLWETIIFFFLQFNKTITIVCASVQSSISFLSFLSFSYYLSLRFSICSFLFDGIGRSQTIISFSLTVVQLNFTSFFRTLKEKFFLLLSMDQRLDSFHTFSPQVLA